MITICPLDWTLNINIVFLRRKIKIAHFYICYVFWSEKSKYDVRISNFGSCWTPAAKKGLKFLSLDTGATNVVSTYFFYHCVRLPKASGGSPISTMTSISYRVFGQESPDNRLFSALQTLDAHIWGIIRCRIEHLLKLDIQKCNLTPWGVVLHEYCGLAIYWYKWDIVDTNR